MSSRAARSVGLSANSIVPSSDPPNFRTSRRVAVAVIVVLPPAAGGGGPARSSRYDPERIPGRYCLLAVAVADAAVPDRECEPHRLCRPDARPEWAGQNDPPSSVAPHAPPRNALVTQRPRRQ